MKRNKHEHEEEHVDESWLLPYSDLMTLLVALFIVLYAMSSADAAKFEQMSQAFRMAFNSGTGVLEGQPALENPVIAKSDKGNVQETPDTAQAQEINELEHIQSQVNQYISEHQLTAKLETQMTDEGLLITIKDDVLFASGSAKVQSSNISIVKDISQLLVMDPIHNVIISGHTDNVPIGMTEFDSNWHLSAMRALNFLNLLLQNKELDPRNFSSKGFGEYKPIDSNATEAGRQRNRRVEILVQSNTIQMN
ncbi:flagellar motor protein MotB [Paenibacillus sp. Leaf72]|uniref:flagellar motor protein MotB n=1 Tax=Paenibacillus sp. Leaf72 TaxID=1736234 RepID=UPI0006F97244|nr:flagellar motor protein MotB [Paenibacillus sp. Leaf72]KQO18632.1 flagellar motor protein MotB [Paenibacillus sp. Leaf72]